jgi:hypothetical protein
VSAETDPISRALDYPRRAMNTVRAKVAVVMLLGGTVIGADCESPGPSPCFSCRGSFANLLLEAAPCTDNTEYSALTSCLCAGTEMQNLGTHCAACLCDSEPSAADCSMCQVVAQITGCSDPCNG